uniref:Uncharacterized protein n=1 Tax=Parastrongyloides trichosuri TaxID=131310 RepID=A0A0N4Z9J8_PARTI
MMILYSLLLLLSTLLPFVVPLFMEDPNAWYENNHLEPHDRNLFENPYQNNFFHDTQYQSDSDIILKHHYAFIQYGVPAPKSKTQLCYNPKYRQVVQAYPELIKLCIKQEQKRIKIVKSEPKPDPETILQLELESKLKSEGESELKTETISELKSEGESELKTGTKSELKSEGESELKTGTKSELKSESKSSNYVPLTIAEIEGSGEEVIN